MWLKKKSDVLALNSAMVLVEMLQKELSETKLLLQDACATVDRITKERIAVEAGQSGRMQALCDEIERVTNNYISHSAQMQTNSEKQRAIISDLQQKLYKANSELYALKHSGYDELDY